MKTMREENRQIWTRLEESLGEIKNEVDRMKSKEEEWKKERSMIEERIQKVEKKLEEGVEGGECGEWMARMKERVRKLEGEGGAV